MKKLLLSVVLLAVIGGTGAWYFDKYDTYEYEHKGFFPLPVLKPLWERKISTEQDVRIGMITDNHAHPNRIDRENKADDAPRYLNKKYMKPLDNFNKEMTDFKPDFVVQLGDVIEGTKEENHVGIMGLELVRDKLSKLNVPVYFALGNHELRSINKRQFKETLDLEDVNQYYDNGDYRFIIIDTNFFPDESESKPGHTSIGGNVPGHVFTWLEPLLQTNKHVFVFMHHPPFGKGEGSHRVVGNGERLRGLFEKYNVTATFSGHIELDYFKEHNGVKYYSFRGAKKSEDKGAIFQRPFYEMIIENGVPNVKMFYVDLDTNRKTEINFEEEIEDLEKVCIERVEKNKKDKKDKKDKEYGYGEE